MRYRVLLSSFLLLVCGEVTAQCSRNCCSKNNMTMEKTGKTTAVKTLSCKLTAPELRKRKAEVIAALKASVTRRETLPSGYSYVFPMSDTMLDRLTEFIKTERQCCDFFDFSVSVGSDDTLVLQITGPEGAKEFIDTELDF